MRLTPKPSLSPRTPLLPPSPSLNAGAGTDTVQGCSQGPTFYVSPGGNDDNTGLAANVAWQTLDRVSRQAYPTGSTIQFEAGQTFAGSICLSGFQGSPLAPLTLTSGPGAPAILRAPMSASWAIALNDCQGIVIRDLKISGPGGTEPPNGIAVGCSTTAGPSLKYYRFSGLTISGFDNGIVLYGGLSDVQITSCSLYDLIANGIFAYGWGPASDCSNKNFLIANNNVHHVVGRDGDTAKGNGILLAQMDGARVSGNLVHDCGSRGEASVGIWAYDANRVCIEHNEVYGQETLGEDGNGFDLDGGVTNSTLQYNYSHDNAGAGYLIWQYAGASAHFNNLVRYNVSINDSRKGSYYGAVTVGGEVLSRVRIHNNILVSTNTAGAGMSALAIWNREDKISDLIAANNLLLSHGGNSFLVDLHRSTQAVRIVGNAYFDPVRAPRFWANDICYNSLASYRAGAQVELLGAEACGLELDPHIMGQLGSHLPKDYRLRSGSLLREAALDLNHLFGLTLGDQDFFGNLLPNSGPGDIGAHQTDIGQMPA